MAPLAANAPGVPVATRTFPACWARGLNCTTKFALAGYRVIRTALDGRSDLVDASATASATPPNPATGAGLYRSFTSPVPRRQLIDHMATGYRNGRRGAPHERAGAVHPVSLRAPAVGLARGSGVRRGGWRRQTGPPRGCRWPPGDASDRCCCGCRFRKWSPSRRLLPVDHDTSAAERRGRIAVLSLAHLVVVDHGVGR